MLLTIDQEQQSELLSRLLKYQISDVEDINQADEDGAIDRERTIEQISYLERVNLLKSSVLLSVFPEDKRSGKRSGGRVDDNRLRD